MVDFYRKYIAEGAFVAVFALIFTLFLRGWLFVDLPTTANSFTEANGFLWSKLIGILHLSNDNLLILNYCLTIVLSLLIAYTSWHFALIREKTYLPFAFSLILFNSHPNFFLFTSASLATLLFFLAISLMFDLYQHPSPQWQLFQISSILAIASLFFVGILPYTIIFFMGLVFLRIFNLRNILALLFGFAFVYWTTLIVCIPMGYTQDFLASFKELNNINFLPLLQFQSADWIVFGVFSVLFILVFADTKLSSHRDKIKTRSQLDFLFFVSFVSFLSYFLMSWDVRFTQLVTLGAFVIPLSHFFALNYNKAKIIFFYVLLLAYVFLCIAEVYLF